ncbi:hypothetical protein B0H21DRAFT_719682 [Amylocystis lapponica]|nr:hypothetical protein B0H21DRAFT_719682 [Amylocystis lapponica]
MGCQGPQDEASRRPTLSPAPIWQRHAPCSRPSASRAARAALCPARSAETLSTAAIVPSPSTGPCDFPGRECAAARCIAASYFWRYCVHISIFAVAEPASCDTHALRPFRPGMYANPCSADEGRGPMALYPVCIWHTHVQHRSRLPSGPTTHGSDATARQVHGPAHPGRIRPSLCMYRARTHGAPAQGPHRRPVRGCLLCIHAPPPKHTTPNGGARLFVLIAPSSAARRARCDFRGRAGDRAQGAGTQARTSPLHPRCAVHASGTRSAGCIRLASSSHRLGGRRVHGMSGALRTQARGECVPGRCRCGFATSDAIVRRARAAVGSDSCVLGRRARRDDGDQGGHRCIGVALRSPRVLRCALSQR